PSGVPAKVVRESEAHITAERAVQAPREKEAGPAASGERRISFELALPSLDVTIPAKSGVPALPMSDEEIDALVVRRSSRFSAMALTSKRATKTLRSVGAVLLLAGAVGGAAWASRSTSGGDGRATTAPATSRQASVPVPAPVAADSAKPHIR